MLLTLGPEISSLGLVDMAVVVVVVVVGVVGVANSFIYFNSVISLFFFNQEPKTAHLSKCSHPLKFFGEQEAEGEGEILQKFRLIVLNL